MMEMWIYDFYGDLKEIVIPFSIIKTLTFLFFFFYPYEIVARPGQEKPEPE